MRRVSAHAGSKPHDWAKHRTKALEVADHDLAAKREHVEALEQEIEKMENLARHVHGEMLTMRQRAEEAEARV